jgi:hypothetical protein
MDIGIVLEELRRKRDQVTEAISMFERMAAGSQRRRGRPPAWMAAGKSATPTKRRRLTTGGKNPRRK